MQRGKCIMNLISQYKGLRKENYVLCFGRFVTAMGAMVRPMLTMILSQKLGMNAVQVAWITALMGILTIPANLIGGKMADRFNKKMNIVYLDMISVISYIICGLLPLTTKSIVLMFIASTCQNMENPSYNSLTADITLSKDRERGYSLQYLTANLGGVMASAVAGFMFRNYLWLAFLLSGISIGTSSVLIYFFVQNITPEKEENDSNAIYQAERHGESLLTILKENRLVLLFILITSGYTALYQMYNYLFPMDAAIREEKLKQEVIDVTLPSKKNTVGHRHPNTIALEEVERIFIGMGYEVVEGPEVEYDLYNFEKLNIPADHPAKDEQDTFYINKDIVLRTQTSPVQARVMEQGKLPIRMIAPGRVFRSDEVDATHSPSFHQIEGLVIDKNISFADLKGTLEVFAKELFGPDTKTKFRPHHFPFTEPSAEVDVSCFKCGGKGCRFCKGSGWIEILGCGMVHPHVLEMCGIDPEEYTGFAFGVGLERIALLKYEIDDMRLLYENDIRFLKQF